jgi:hypothetical protein
MTGPGPHRSSRGIALVTVLLVSSLVFVIAMGLTMILTVGRLVARNHRDAAVLLAAARAGVELAADALAIDDWQLVLSGTLIAAGSDGPASGVRSVDGSRIDLAAETDRLNCGRPSPCSAAERAAISLERPWGADNPTWQLYLFGPLGRFGAYRFPAALYVLVWVADDSRESDGRPDVDGGAGPGRHLVRVRAMAVGRDGARRVVDAELVRICVPTHPACEPGIRVQSERERRLALP